MPNKAHKKIIADAIIGLFSGWLLLVALIAIGLQVFEQKYRNRVYPNVAVAGLTVSGKTKEEVTSFWLSKNAPFTEAVFTFSFHNQTATVSGAQLNAGYDATLSATQAMAVGRSGHFFADFYAKFAPSVTNLSPLFRWDEETLDDILKTLSQYIDIPVQDALFTFANGRVTAFRPSREGRHANIPAVKEKFRESLTAISADKNIHIPISVTIDIPTFTTDRVNSFGIKELVGRGYSEFAHSIPGRIHNVTLAAAKINGILIKPGDTFSFNEALGDVSALTGFQPAYIIKEGKTVLGDGGGVCQVSTTLFRAALAAGLPIAERRAHAYRVSYYEQAGFKAGLDATVFAPSVDLKIKNNTPAYILIQTKTDTKNLTLTIELYGTGDGRSAQISDHRVWAETAPPPPLYQDDPTLKAGVIKQVDFAAWGAKASFRYRVTRGGEVLEDTDFFSNFRPWQAVYLGGTAQ